MPILSSDRAQIAVGAPLVVTILYAGALSLSGGLLAAAYGVAVLLAVQALYTAATWRRSRHLLTPSGYERADLAEILAVHQTVRDYAFAVEELARYGTFALLGTEAMLAFTGALITVEVLTTASFVFTRPELSHAPGSLRAAILFSRLLTCCLHLACAGLVVWMGFGGAVVAAAFHYGWNVLAPDLLFGAVVRLFCGAERARDYGVLG